MKQAGSYESVSGCGCESRTYVILEDDCPYEAQDDGRLAIDDVRNVYVDQFNLGSNREVTETQSCISKGEFMGE